MRLCLECLPCRGYRRLALRDNRAAGRRFLKHVLILTPGRQTGRNSLRITRSNWKTRQILKGAHRFRRDSHAGSVKLTEAARNLADRERSVRLLFAMRCSRALDFGWALLERGPWAGWPARQSNLLFAGLAFGEPPYLELWKRLGPDPANVEVRRNLAITQPVLWLGTQKTASMAAAR